MAGKGSERTTRSARRLTLVALLGLLVIGLGAWAAFAASLPPAPSITVSPAVFTNSQSASFAYKDSATIQKFQCSLDGAAFSDCGTTNPATKSYSGLAAGSHTFQVRAVTGNGANGTSPATSYSWTVDLTPPTVSSINRAGPSPTNATSVSWTVTFNEDVNGVDATDFALARSGALTGGSVTAVTPAGPATTYTVTASTGTGDGTLGLNLVDNDSVKDKADNALGGTGTTGAPNGSFTGQSYSIDKTRPTVSSIARAGASPTNAASVSWTVTFSEPVTSVTAGNVSLVATGLSGTVAITSVSGSGSVWTVTASTGTGTPSGSGSLQLNLSSTSGITDTAGNTLNATPPVTGPVYTFDKTAPPVAFGIVPPDPSSNASSHFTWSQTPSAGDFDHFECSTENGPFSTQVQSQGGAAQPCASPLTYVVGATNNGKHQFAVRAYDVIGNFTEITYTWKVAAGSPQEFSVSGSVSGLAPGVTASIPVTISNPNDVPIYVSQLSFTVSTGTNSGSCPASSYIVTPWTASAGPPAVPEFQVPAHATNFAVPAADRPKITMADSPTINQDNCKGKSFSLRFSGSAHS
jgi:hypothetical protein